MYYRYMDRFSETLPDLAAGRAAHRARIYGDEPALAVVHVCENCGRAADKLYPVAEFEYMGCGGCKEEAERIIAADPMPLACEERAGAIMTATSVPEFRELLRAHEAECTLCASLRAGVGSEHRVASATKGLEAA